MSIYRRCLPALTSKSSYADSDDTSSMSLDALMQRDFNNDLLSQAISYLAAEGDDDSPATYIDRVRFIDVKLLQQLPAQGSQYDMKLYRRVRSMVRAVQREYEDAVDTSPDLIGDDDDVPELHLSSPVEALFRADDDEGTPLRTPRPAKIETQRHFRYGGPDSEVEIWHKDLPNSLPFPETIRMQDWESMRIEFDLACSADRNITEPVLTNVPYEHPDLQRHDSLAHYESGSRFKLPEVDAEVLGMVNQVGTVDNLRRAVSSFNQGGMEQIRKTREYTPRVFLENLRVHRDTVVGRTPSPTSIRRAMDDTPTRARPGSGEVRVGTISKGMRTLLGQGPTSTSSSDDSISGSSTTEAPSTSVLETSSLSKPETGSTRASPAARRISRVVNAAIAGSSKPRLAPPNPHGSSARPSSPAARSRTTSPTRTSRAMTPSSTKPSTKRKRATSHGPTYRPERSPTPTSSSSSSSSSSPSPSSTIPAAIPSSKAPDKRKRATSADPTYRPEESFDSSTPSPSPSPTLPAAASPPTTKSPAKRKRATSRDPSYRPEKKRACHDGGSSSSGEEDEGVLFEEEE